MKKVFALLGTGCFEQGAEKPERMQADPESHQFWYNLSGNEKEARLSTKMVPHAKKEAPASPKGKAKALKVKKVVLNGIHSLKKRKIHILPSFQ